MISTIVAGSLSKRAFFGAVTIILVGSSGLLAGDFKIGDLLADPVSNNLRLVTVEGVVHALSGGDKITGVERCPFKIVDESGAIYIDNNSFCKMEGQEPILFDGDRVIIDATFVDGSSVHGTDDYPEFRPPFKGASYLYLQSIRKISR